MSDIDFITDLTGSFTIALGDNPQKVTGNRALLNRFELTFLTKRRQFLVGDTPVVDNYGGDAGKFVNRPAVIADIQSISAALSTAMEQTVQCMMLDQSTNLPDTEKIVSAEILSVNVVADVVTTSIKVNPVEVEAYNDLIFNLPIIKMM